MKNKGGRPLKLSNEVREILISSIRKGLTLKAACKCAGISYSTFANWRQKNRKQVRLKESTELYEFVAAIDTEICQIQCEHRLKAHESLKSRDYRFGWKNPISDETKQKRRFKWLKRRLERFTYGI